MTRGRTPEAAGRVDVARSRRPAVVVDKPMVKAALSELWRRAQGHVPGALAVLAGAAILSAMVLVPAHEALREARWRRAVMQVQASHLEALAERYRTFEHALAAGEPVLLERLAYAQLRMQPVEKRGLWELTRSVPGGSESAAMPLAEELDDAADLHAWLAQPLPTVGRDLAAHRPVESRLARLASGDRRLGLIVAAGLLLLGGLLWSPRPEQA